MFLFVILYCKPVYTATLLTGDRVDFRLDPVQQFQLINPEVTAGETAAFYLPHRGVIRALYALATGWDMRTDPPDKLSRKALQVFSLERGGQPRVAELNVRLDAEIVT